jgi:hypothetical protein
MSNNSSKSGGMSLFTLVGVCIAVAWSWSTNHAVGWAILHAFLNWIYVIYRLCGFGG